MKGWNCAKLELHRSLRRSPAAAALDDDFSTGLSQLIIQLQQHLPPSSTPVTMAKKIVVCGGNGFLGITLSLGSHPSQPIFPSNHCQAPASAASPPHADTQSSPSLAPANRTGPP